MLARLIDHILRHRHEAFAPVFYDMHRRRFEAALRWQFGCLTLALLLAAAAIVPMILLGVDRVLMARIAVVLLILALVIQAPGILDLLQARVLPFFEREVGGTDTWLAGKHLLWASRRLDEIAEQMGVPPLSAFASGDPLIQGEAGTLYDARAGLASAEELLAAAMETGLGAKVEADLEKLRDALRLAAEQGIRFSLHVREGRSASGAEMARRGGSYF